MNDRFLAAVIGLVVSAVVATAPVAGQAGATSPKTNGSTPKAYAAARTPDGQPDLQGFWTNATYTPLERAKNVTKEFYTREEALESAARRLAAVRRKIARLSSAARAEWERDVDRLAVLRDTLKPKLVELKEQGERAGRSVREQAEKIGDELAEVLQRLEAKAKH